MNIVLFNFKTNDIRVIIDKNGAPLFIAKDIAVTLGYKDAPGAVAKHCKKTKPLKDVGSPFQLPKLDQQLKLIPESDVYRLILRSKLDSAEEFQDWVFEDVLPSIRKTGSYSVKPSLEQMTLEVIKGQQDKILQLKNKIEADKPLTAFAEAVSQSVGTCLIGDWVKAINDSGDIKIGRNKAFRWLRDNKYLMKNNNPYQKYIDSGLFDLKESLIISGTRTIPKFTTLITGKGQIVLAEKLKSAMGVA